MHACAQVLIPNGQAVKAEQMVKEYSTYLRKDTKDVRLLLPCRNCCSCWAHLSGTVGPPNIVADGQNYSEFCGYLDTVPLFSVLQ